MKKTSKLIAGLSLALMGLMAADAAFAGGRHHHHGSRVRFAFHFGAPIGIAAYGYPYYPYYYAPAPVYYSSPVVVQQQPPVYIEQQAAPAPAQSYWYYCSASRAYYPYVRDCPGGWQRVAPQPN
jgi:hypothetical protein